MLQPEELQAFVTVADTHSFVQAADRLGVVQSVVSKRLRHLEDRLGAPLVDRSNKRAIALTRFGALFLDEARAVLAQLELTERVGARYARGETGPLRIGYVFSAVMTGLVTRIVRRLASQRPDLEVRLVLMETPDQLVAIEDGRIDFALARPRPSYPPGTEATVVHREGIVLARSAQASGDDRSGVRIADLAAETFVVPQFKESVGLVEHVLALAARGGFQPPRMIETPDYIGAAALAAAGQGVVLAPASLQRLGLVGLSFAPLADFAVDLELVLVRPVGAVPALARIILDECLEPGQPENVPFAPVISKS